MTENDLYHCVDQIFLSNPPPSKFQSCLETVGRQICKNTVEWRSKLQLDFNWNAGKNTKIQWWTAFILKATVWYASKKRNGILLPKSFWPTVRKEKIVLVIEKNFWNLRLKANNLQIFWDHWNNIFKQWKFRTFFVTWMLFQLVSGDLEQLEFKFEKVIGI